MKRAYLDGKVICRRKWTSLFIRSQRRLRHKKSSPLDIPLLWKWRSLLRITLIQLKRDRERTNVEICIVNVNLFVLILRKIVEICSCCIIWDIIFFVKVFFKIGMPLVCCLSRVISECRISSDRVGNLFNLNELLVIITFLNFCERITPDM